MRRQQQLLRVKPHDKLTFRFDRHASSTIGLSNNSEFHVAFKVWTTNKKKFEGGPSYGILMPGSVCYVKVTVVGQMEAPSNRQHREKVIIKTLVASPDDTKESLPTLFKQRAAMVEDYELRVEYDFPLHQQSSNLERSGADSSRNASAFGVRNSSYVKLDRNRSSWDFLKKGIIVVLSCLIFWYLTVQILSRLWTLISMIMVLVVKMMSNRAVEAAEDWIKRTLVYLCLYFLAAVRENLLDLCSRWLNVISNAFLDLLTAIFGHEERR